MRIPDHRPRMAIDRTATAANQRPWQGAPRRPALCQRFLLCRGDPRLFGKPAGSLWQSAITPDQTATLGA